MTALAPLIPALKREVSGPGEFDADFPSSDDGELLGSLEDGFGQAQLDGFFGTTTLNLTTHSTDLDLSIAGQQLVVIYAGERILRSKLRNLNTKVLYKAGGVEYATENSAGAITELLKDIQDRKQRLLDQVLRAGRAQNSVHVTDGYLIRSQGYYPMGTWGEFGGFFGYELAGLGGGLSSLLF